MHISTETDHPKHICSVDGVGVTSTARKVIEALARFENHRGTTTDIKETAHLRDRKEAFRSLKRLRDAGVVESEESDIDIPGLARSPLIWSLRDHALRTGIVERLRAGTDKPLDPVEEREQRITELETTVKKLQTDIEHLRDEVDVLRRASDIEDDPWQGINPSQ